MPIRKAGRAGGDGVHPTLPLPKRITSWFVIPSGASGEGVWRRT